MAGKFSRFLFGRLEQSFPEGIINPYQGTRLTIGQVCLVPICYRISSHFGFTGETLISGSRRKGVILRPLLGGVYMRKLALARVSYRDDIFISYRVHDMTGSFPISLFEGTFHVDKLHVRFKIANITRALPVPVQSRPISHRNLWSFRVYMIPLRDFVSQWNSRPGTRTGVNSRWGDSRRHGILWWYHVNKCRAMRGNRSELTPGRKSPRCHINTP